MYKNEVVLNCEVKSEKAAVLEPISYLNRQKKKSTFAI